ncbi:hypothetical protein A2U01_0056601, partial [Trifolium medium]|nr:hypothetical protein [Trifolium medium]
NSAVPYTKKKTQGSRIKGNKFSFEGYE